MRYQQDAAGELENQVEAREVSPVVEHLDDFSLDLLEIAGLQVKKEQNVGYQCRLGLVLRVIRIYPKAEDAQKIRYEPVFQIVAEDDGPLHNFLPLDKCALIQGYDYVDYHQGNRYVEGSVNEALVQILRGLNFSKGEEGSC